MHTKKVKDVMLSLSEYGHVDSDATLCDVVTNLAGALVNAPEGKYPHRAMLVYDEDGNIVGKMGHFAFMRALVTAGSRPFELHVDRLSGLSDDMVSGALSTMRLVAGEEDWSLRALNTKVRDFMHPMNQRIDEEATLEEAAHLFVEEDMLSVLVTNKQRVCGILRLCDLFDEVASVVKTGCPE